MVVAVLALVAPLTIAPPAQALVSSTVSLAVGPSVAAPAESVVFSGRVSPVAPGRRVLLQRSGSSWSTVTSVTTTASGAYSASVRAGAAGSRTSWRAVAPVAGTTPQAISATRTLSVVRATLSLAAPASAETRLAFSLAGSGNPVRAGRTVVVQRLSGRSWIEVGRAVEAANGRYSVRTSLSGAGRFSFRAVAVSWRGAASVVSVTRLVSAHLPYILLAPSTAIAGETVRVTGLLPGVSSRPVWVQRRSGTRWVTIVQGRTSRTGSYSASFRAPARGSYALRSLAPRVTISRVVRAQYVTAAKTLTVVAQTAVLSMPATVVQGGSAAAALRFTPVRAARTVALQIWRSGVWTTAASGRQSSAGATSFTVATTTVGSYSYRAWTAALSGAPAFAGVTRILTVTAPSVGPVTGLVAHPAKTSIALSWTNPASAPLTGVLIRRALGATPPASATAGLAVTDVPVPGASYTDTGLSPGTTYSYAVFAHDGVPGYSARASVVSTTIAIPGPVTALVATPGSTSMALTWANPAQASLTGVMIRRAPGATPPASASAGVEVADAVAPATSFTDTGLAPGTTYSYAVFAHDSTPSFAAGATVTRTTLAVPGPVTDLRASPDSTRIALSWTNPSEASLAGVMIRRALGATPPVSASAGAEVADADNTATSFTDTGLTPGTTYTYALFAHDGTPTYAAAATVTSTTVAPGQISGRVTDEAGPQAGLAGVRVNVTSESTGTNGNAVTDSAGDYLVTGLAAGTDYAVCFLASESTSGGSSAFGYVDECYDDQPVLGTPNAVEVVSEETTAGIGAGLAGGGGIHGTVTDTAGVHAGLAGVRVNVTSASTGIDGSALTGADGSYAVTGLASAVDYAVCFDTSLATGGSSATGYVDECFENQAVGSSTPVTVVLGDSTLVNADLGGGGAIAGTATDVTLVGQGLAGVEVWASSTSSAAIRSTLTAADGSYTLPGLVGGVDYTVCFNGSGGTGGRLGFGYWDQCYSGRATSENATLVTVLPAATQTGIDAAMIPREEPRS